jgi:DNA processing protein
VSPCADCGGGRLAAGAWAVCRHEPAYPAQLLDLDQGLPGIESAPGVVYGCGQPEAFAEAELDATVTIVGSRRATPYGVGIAGEIARDLAAAGVVVVSGLAYGIDAAAHRGALEAGGTTIAILAGGPDVVYPASAAATYRRILERGASISERPPGTVPERWSFPVRNRLMAAIAAVTVVVEAAQPSGSTVTANKAIAIGRTVGAVPGPVHSRVSAGTIALLRDGAAVVTDAGDVLDLLYGVGSGAAARCGPALDPELAPVLEAVEAGAQSPDAIAARTGLGGREVAIALTRLELVGYLGSGPSGLYSRTALRLPEPGGGAGRS